MRGCSGIVEYEAGKEKIFFSYVFMNDLSCLAVLQKY